MEEKRQLKTLEEARESFLRTGTSMAAWAREHGVSHETVYRVLKGLNKGLRGDSHKVAVLLGIKDGEIVE